MMEQERPVVKKAVIFELRLQYTWRKGSYSREEAVGIIDEIAVEREGETWI